MLNFTLQQLPNQINFETFTELVEHVEVKYSSEVSKTVTNGNLVTLLIHDQFHTVALAAVRLPDGSFILTVG